MEPSSFGINLPTMTSPAGSAIATDGTQGLSMSMAEALAHADWKSEPSTAQHMPDMSGGATADYAAFYCLDRAPTPDEAWDESQSCLMTEWEGSWQYKQQDIIDTGYHIETITAIAEDNRRLDGAIASAVVQQLTPATEYQNDARK